MNIQIIAVGKLKEKYLREAAQEYVKRLSRHVNVSMVEVRDEPVPAQPSRADIERVLQFEADRILGRLRPTSYTVALDVTGEEVSTEELAHRLDDLMLHGYSHISFLIGGSHGLHSSVLSKANWRLSFSRLTFPHQLMRIILLEQLYRCFTILRGQPYHK